MQKCFVESNLKIVAEVENLDQGVASDNLNFRSYVAGDDCLPQIQVFLWLKSGVIQLSMFFQEELAEVSFQEVLALMNDISLSSAGSYWISIPGLQKIEFRTAYLLPGDDFNMEQFKNVLRKFLDQGLLQYSYLKNLIKNPGPLIN
jgi:hypothetical protein